MVREAVAQSFSRIDYFAREDHLARFLLAYDARQKNRGHRRKDAQFDFRLAKLGPIARNNDVAGRDEFAAATESRAINQRNRRPRDLIELAENIVKRVEHLDHRFRHVLFDGDTGAEGARAFSGFEYDRNEIILVGAIIQRVANLAHHGNVEDVERRPREGDSGDLISNLESDILEFSHLAYANASFAAVC